MKERDAESPNRGLSGRVLPIISEGVEPGEHARIAFPRRRLATCSGCVNALERLSFCFKIGLGVVVRRVEADMPKPTADDGDIDACGDEMDGGRMPEAVRGHMLRP